METGGAIDSCGGWMAVAAPSPLDSADGASTGCGTSAGAGSVGGAAGSGTTEDVSIGAGVVGSAAAGGSGTGAGTGAGAGTSAAGGVCVGSVSMFRWAPQCGQATTTPACSTVSRPWHCPQVTSNAIRFLRNISSRKDFESAGRRSLISCGKP